MKKKVFGRKFSRSRKARIALFRSLIKALISYGKIETTKARAKAIQGEVEKLVTLAKKGQISQRRGALKVLANDKNTVDILFDKVAPVFSQRKSGFTRITLLPPRFGDASEMARIEWVESIEVKEKPKEAKKGKKVEIKKETVKKSSKKTKRQ